MTGVRTYNRRNFLASVSATAAFTVIPRHVLGMPGVPAANDRLQIAGIGVGGIGSLDIQRVPTEQLVAICDVDSRQAAAAAKPFPDAKLYADYREMLATRPDIDAVMIAAPDHQHAMISVHAMRLGKHVFCQKPLTHSVHEALTVAQVAKETGVATQMGNQFQADEPARLICEYIWSGAIGAVREVHSWSNRRPDISRRGVARPTETPPVPAELNWDQWIGPAPMRPYHPSYHPFNWRSWWDFGTGVLGDIGCHNLSAVFKALQLGWPESVEACSTHWPAPPEVRNESSPLASIVTYRFAATERHPDLVLKWYDGGMMPPMPKGIDIPNLFIDDGTLIVGDEGMLLGAKLLPESKAKAVGAPPRKLERSPGHYQEWVNACKGGAPAGSNFVDHAAHLAAVILMGNIAIRTEEKMYWDAEQLKFKNSEAGNALLNPPYRDGWKLG